MLTIRYSPFYTSGLAIAAIATSVFLGAKQGKETDPIDRALAGCLEKNSSTSGMNNCTMQATKAWDADLNRNYKKLSAQLRPDSRALLVASQRAWLKFRDSEFGYLDHAYARAKGTMFSTMRLSDECDFIKARALEIRHHLDLEKEISDSGQPN